MIHWHVQVLGWGLPLCMCLWWCVGLGVESTSWLLCLTRARDAGIYLCHLRWENWWGRGSPRFWNLLWSPPKAIYACHSAPSSGLCWVPIIFPNREWVNALSSLTQSPPPPCPPTPAPRKHLVKDWAQSGSSLWMSAVYISVLSESEGIPISLTSRAFLQPCHRCQQASGGSSPLELLRVPGERTRMWERRSPQLPARANNL